MADPGHRTEAQDHLLVHVQDRDQQQQGPQQRRAVVLARLRIGTEGAGVVIADHDDQARAQNREEQAPVTAPAGGPDLIGLPRTQGAANIAHVRRIQRSGALGIKRAHRSSPMQRTGCEPPNTQCMTGRWLSGSRCQWNASGRADERAAASEECRTATMVGCRRGTSRMLRFTWIMACLPDASWRHVFPMRTGRRIEGEEGVNAGETQRTASCTAQEAAVGAEASLRYAPGRAVRDAVHNPIDYCPRRPHASNDGAHCMP